MSRHDNEETLKQAVIAVLQGIFDPEIPVNIYELGLIYHVDVTPDKQVKITMTLTSPNCPVAEALPAEVLQKTEAIDGVQSADLHLTFDPPWSQDNMSDEAKLALGLL